MQAIGFTIEDYVQWLYCRGNSGRRQQNQNDKEREKAGAESSIVDSLAADVRRPFGCNLAHMDCTGMESYQTLGIMRYSCFISTFFF